MADFWSNKYWTGRYFADRYWQASAGGPTYLELSGTAAGVATVTGTLEAAVVAPAKRQHGRDQSKASRLRRARRERRARQNNQRILTAFVSMVIQRCING